MTQETQLAPSQFVEQILAINTSPGTLGEMIDKQPPQMDFPPWGHVDSASSDLLFGAAHSSWPAQGDANDTSIEYQDWDNLGMQFSDNFGIDFGTGS